MYQGDLDDLATYGCERIVLCQDPESGLRAVIALHSTALGPAVGGMRVWAYPSTGLAVADAARLARAMTLKYAVSGVDLGGGKAVVIGDARTCKAPALLLAMARFIDQLRGDYYVGQDVGTTLADMATMFTATSFVMTLPTHLGGAGEIAPATARGVLQALRACLDRVFGSPEMAGRTVALQGLGSVGRELLRQLAAEGARMTVTDIDERKCASAVAEFGVVAVAPDAIYDVDADVFAPCALGGILDISTVHRLKAPIICGAANNQLKDDSVLESLADKGITWAVDFVTNAGGAIHDADRLRPGGFLPDRAFASVDQILDRTREIFTIADREGITAHAAAHRLAQRRLELARTQR